MLHIDKRNKVEKLKKKKSFPKAIAYPGIQLDICNLAAHPKPVLAASRLWVGGHSMSTDAWSGVICWSKTAPPSLSFWCCRGKSPHLGRTSSESLSSRCLCDLGFRACPLLPTVFTSVVWKWELAHFITGWLRRLNEPVYKRETVVQGCYANVWQAYSAREITLKENTFTQRVVFRCQPHMRVRTEFRVVSWPMTYARWVLVKNKKSRCSHETQARWKTWCPDHVKGF